MIKRLTKREQGIFIACASLIFIYVGFNGIFKPLKETSQMVDRKIEVQQRRLDKDMRIIRKAKALGKEYSVILEQFKQSESDEQVMSKIFLEIERVADELGLKIADLKPKKVRKVDFYNRFSVSLTLESQFQEIVHFIYILQKQPLLFDIDEVRFEQGPRRNRATINTHLILSKILIL